MRTTCSHTSALTLNEVIIETPKKNINREENGGVSRKKFQFKDVKS